MMTEKQCHELIHKTYGRQEVLTNAHAKLWDFDYEIYRTWCAVLDGVDESKIPAAEKFSNAIGAASQSLAVALEALRELNALEWNKLIKLYDITNKKYAE